MRTSHTIGHLLSLNRKRCSLRFAVASSVSTKLPAGMIFRRRNILSWDRGLRIKRRRLGLRGCKSTSMLLSSLARSCSIEHAPM